MSRSKRKTPIFPVCRSTGSKKWKNTYNRSMRRCQQEEHPKKIEYSDIWTGPYDGKFYMHNPEPKWMRK